LLPAWAAFTFILLSPPQSYGQWVTREALSSFPADTHQMTYLDLAQLRTLAEYPRIRQRLLSRQLQDFQNFLRSAGTDPEKDVDEVVVGWRGEALGGAGFFGLMGGRFDPDRVREFFEHHQLPSRQYDRFHLYTFGSGESRGDIFFAFLSSSLAAMGPLDDLEALLDVRAKARPGLDSTSGFPDWEAELEGTAPQWGIATGKAAANQAAPWLTAAGKVSVDPTIIFSPVRAVLYRVDWGSGISTHVSILCRDTAAASALSALLILWRDSRGQTNSASPGIDTFLQGLDVQLSETRVELNATGPWEAVDQIFSASTNPAVP